MKQDEIREEAKKLLEKMTIQQKLAQVIGMFGGGSVPAQLFHRFPNGLGAPAVPRERASTVIG